jgi:hypothetical protein
MSDSIFDPNALLNSTVTEAFTKRHPIPAGKELIGVIGELKIRQNAGKKDPTKMYTFLDITIEIDLSQDPEVQSIVGQPKVTLRDSCILDTTPSGTLDVAPGKNVGLRRYREALDMNTPGQPFSFSAMQGRPVRVKIKNEPYNDDIIDGVAAIARP